MKRTISKNGASRNVNGNHFHKNGESRPVLITGGSGFIGTNVAHRFLSNGQRVLLFDNLSRHGVKQNFEWLKKTHGDLVDIEVADVRDLNAVKKAARHASKVFHFAAQVAVTTSLTEPIEDFEINGRGTLNLLEALRALDEPPPLIYTSTNKVYGEMKDVGLCVNDGRYEPEDSRLREFGFSENRPLNFHSPYGCSKGCAEQYVLDYARTFRLPAIVFRMSCIYGLHQFGTEDQGWVAHFLIRALEGKPITIYGDGRQVRDVLFVEDLVNAFLLAHQNMARLSGQAFNIGGGPANTISLLELLDLIRELKGEKAEVTFDEWRSADQQYYVSDIRKFSTATGWKPQTNVADGVRRLYEWLAESRETNGRAIQPNGNATALDGAEQLAIMRERNGSGAIQPRSKRLWEKAKANGHARREDLRAS
jgi:CDP-paratose 2-epimerase